MQEILKGYIYPALGAVIFTGLLLTFASNQIGLVDQKDLMIFEGKMKEMMQDVQTLVSLDEINKSEDVEVTSLLVEIKFTREACEINQNLILSLEFDSSKDPHLGSVDFSRTINLHDQSTNLTYIIPKYPLSDLRDNFKGFAISSENESNIDVLGLIYMRTLINNEYYKSTTLPKIMQLDNTRLVIEDGIAFNPFKDYR